MRFLDDGHAFVLDDELVTDLRLTRPFGRASVFVDLLNATDEEYSELGYVLPDFTGTEQPYEFPASGFTFRPGLEWEL